MNTNQILIKNTFIKLEELIKNTFIKLEELIKVIKSTNHKLNSQGHLGGKLL